MGPAAWGVAGAAAAGCDGVRIYGSLRCMTTASAYWSWGRIRNVGDDMMPYIISSLTGRNSIRVKTSEPHIMGSGSILSSANENSIVWGSGLLNQHCDISGLQPKHIRAVRGHKTRDILSRAGLTRQDVQIGDPGIFSREIAINYSFRLKSDAERIAVVPHHDFVGHPFYRAFEGSNEVAIVEPFDNSLAFFRAIFNSEVVISQSLHGLIIAEALGKPSVWIANLDDENWNFKFEDWFSTTEHPQLKPTYFGGAQPSRQLDTLVAQALLHRSLIDKPSLRATFPLDPEVSLHTSYFDVHILRQRVPFVASLSTQINASRDFESLSPTEIVEIDKTVMIALENVYQACPERSYCLVITPGFSKPLSQMQRDVICHIMDLDTHVDYVSIIQSDDIPSDFPRTEFAHEVFLLEEGQVFGAAFCVRPDFNGFTRNFRTLVV